jgi:hypothetical protein
MRQPLAAAAATQSGGRPSRTICPALRLVDPAWPARDGWVDPANLLFARDRIQQVRKVVQAKSEARTTLDEQCAAIYRQHPFYESPDLVALLRRLVESPDFRRATELP